jgi:hypothetical protein
MGCRSSLAQFHLHGTGLVGPANAVGWELLVTAQASHQQGLDGVTASTSKFPQRSRDGRTGKSVR